MKTPAEILEELGKDWFVRDGKTYMLIRNDRRLNWEKTLAEGEPYSAWILASPTQDDLIKRAYGLAKDMITVMNPPFKVTVHIAGGTSATNGKHLFVSTKMFDDKDLSTGEKLDVFLGTTIHEGCHLLYTDFLVTRGMSKSVHAIYNIIEDERIEELCGQKTPGLAKFLEKSKYYYFDKNYMDAFMTGKLEDLSLYQRFMNVFLGIVRYPKYVTEMELLKFSKYLLQIKEILIPFPTSTRQSADAAYKVFEVIKEMYKDLAKEIEEAKKEGKSSGSAIDRKREEVPDDIADSLPSEAFEDGGEDTDGKKKKSRSKKSDEALSDSGEESGEETSGKGDKSDEGKPDAGGTPTGGSDDTREEGTDKDSSEVGEEPADDKPEEEETPASGKDGEETPKEETPEETPEEKSEESKEPTKEELEKALDDFDKDSSEVGEELDEVSPDTTESRGLDGEDMAAAVAAHGGLLGELCEGTVELGTTKDTYFSKEAGNEGRYRESYERVRRYIPAFSRILQGHCKEYKLIHRSMRSGQLDTSKLAEAYQGVPTVYIREGEVKTDKVAVVILIDESGSMASGCGLGRDRITAARDMAVLMNEAFGKIPNIELFIYGHTGDIRDWRSTEMYVYCEGSYRPKYAIGSAAARCENRDGTAILEVGKRVRRITKTPAIMFILSDGQPCAGGYNGESAMLHVKNCVKQVEAMDMSVVQVCISKTYDPGKMFKHYMVMENMDTLAVDLGKVIKKAAMQSAKQHVS